MAWRAARSLLVLLGQINARHPGRSKASDGIIGDPAHQAQGSGSDHNPDDDIDGDGRGEGPAVDDIVRALDVTHDPAHGCDIGVLSDQLAASRDRRISYVIANRLIMSGPGGPSPWVWRTYGGDDPHTEHLHLSVVDTAAADSTTPWALGPGGEGDDMDPALEASLKALTQSYDGVNGIGGGSWIARAVEKPLTALRQQLADFVATERASDAAAATAIAGLRATVEALTAALTTGTGTVLDTAAILARVDTAAAEVRTLVQQQHQADVAALRAQLEALTQGTTS